MIQPDGQAVHAPDGCLRGRHRKAGGGGLILGIAEEMHVAIDQAGNHGEFGEVDNLDARGRFAGDASDTVFFHDDIDLRGNVAGAHINQASGQNGRGLGVGWRRRFCLRVGREERGYRECTDEESNL
jgi:hypothetical protein